MTAPLTRSTLRTTAVLGVRLLMQAGTLLLVARILGPEQFGAFAGMASLAVLLGAVATFGTHLVLLSEMSRDPKRRNVVLVYAAPTAAISGALLLVVYLCISLVALSGLGLPLEALLAIGIAELCLQPLLLLQATEQQAIGRIARSQLLIALPLMLRLLAAGVLAQLRPDDMLLVYSLACLGASATALLVGTVTLRAPWPGPRRWRLPGRRELRQTAGFAALSITKAGPTELDKILAIKLLPLAVSGSYAAGARIIGATTLPVTAMLLSALPRLFRDTVRSPERAGRLQRQVIAVAVVYGFALSIALWLFSAFVARLFGPSYEYIGEILQWLCLAAPGMTLRVATGNLLMSLNRPWLRAGLELAGVAVLTVAAVVLVARLGHTGMPIALACSEWTMAIGGLSGVLAISRQRQAQTLHSSRSDK